MLRDPDADFGAKGRSLSLDARSRGRPVSSVLEIDANVAAWL